MGGYQRRFAMLNRDKAKKPSKEMRELSYAPPENIYFEATVSEGKSVLIVRDADSGKVLAHVTAKGGDKETAPEFEQQIFERIGTEGFRRVIGLVTELAKVGGSHEDFAESWA